MFWLNTKSKVQKFKSLIYIYIYIFFFFVLYILYICGTFSLLSIYHGLFFLVYIFVTFLLYKLLLLFFLKFCHIVIIINSKLEIGHDILKNISS